MANQICTIGFSKKSLKYFVNLLQKNKVTKLVDTRLNNTSQLSGFAKKDDLHYVMNLIGIQYEHDLTLAPTANILEDYKKKRIDWPEYEKKYLDLLYSRKTELKIDEIIGDSTPCFLCSEDKPHHCHRRLLVEYLKQYNKEIEIVHLI